MELKGAGVKGCADAWYRWSQALFQEQRRLGQVPGTMMLSPISASPSCGHCIEPILSHVTHSGRDLTCSSILHPQSLRPSSSAMSNPHPRSQLEWSSQPRGGSRERFGSWLLNGKGCDSATRQSGCHWMGGHRTGGWVKASASRVPLVHGTLLVRPFPSPAVNPSHGHPTSNTCCGNMNMDAPGMVARPGLCRQLRTVGDLPLVQADGPLGR